MSFYEDDFEPTEEDLRAEVIRPLILHMDEEPYSLWEQTAYPTSTTDILVEIAKLMRRMLEQECDFPFWEEAEELLESLPVEVFYR